MHSVTCTITSKGQITIPKRIRDELGIGASDKLEFVILESGRVEVRPKKYRWKDLDGIVPAIPGRETEDFDDLIDEAIEEQAIRKSGLNFE